MTRMVLVIVACLLGLLFIAAVTFILFLRSVAKHIANSDHGYYNDDVVDYEK